MNLVAVVLVGIAGVYAGYHYRWMEDAWANLREAVQELRGKRQAEEEVEPVIYFDPDDIAFQTRVAVEEKRKELNRTVFVEPDDE